LERKKMGKLSFPCPICGKKTEYPPEELAEGTVLTCLFCGLTLTLHGHMWKDVQKEIERLKDNSLKNKKRG